MFIYNYYIINVKPEYFVFWFMVSTVSSWTTASLVSLAYKSKNCNTADIIPLVSTKHTTEARDFRQISLIPVIAKYLEKLIAMHIASSITDSMQLAYKRSRRVDDALSLMCWQYYRAPFSALWIHESHLSMCRGSAGPKPLRISRSQAMTLFSVKSFTLFMVKRVWSLLTDLLFNSHITEHIR